MVPDSINGGLFSSPIEFSNRSPLPNLFALSTFESLKGDLIWVECSPGELRTHAKHIYVFTGKIGLMSHPPHQPSSLVPPYHFSNGSLGVLTKPTGIYEYDKIFEQAMHRLQIAKDVADQDKVAIGQLVDHLIVKGVSKQRAVKYVNHLIVTARMAGCPLETLDRKGVEAVIAKLNLSDYKEHTKHDYKVIIKKYFQWIRKCDEEVHEYPVEVKWIKTKFKKQRLVPEALLTPEELKKLIDACENQRDRALLLTHYDGGFRIGETMSMKIVNVEFDKYGAVVKVDGKTGPRRVRLTVAAHELAAWLSLHPFRNDPEAYLWIGIGSVGKNELLSYFAVRALFKRLAKKTGLKKRLYSHLMRHSRATELANVLTEAQMKEHLGWVPGSDMPSTYVHLSGRDVDGALLKAHGITVDKEQKNALALTLTKCPRCSKDISSNNQFCPSCGMVLDGKAAMGLEEERIKADRLMDLLMKDEEVRQLLFQKVQDFYKSSQPHHSKQATP